MPTTDKLELVKPIGGSKKEQRYIKMHNGKENKRHNCGKVTSHTIDFESSKVIANFEIGQEE